jgi:hypothetical protein
MSPNVFQISTQRSTTMAQNNFPALPGIYRVLFLYLEPSEPHDYRDTDPRSLVYPNSIHRRPSDHGLALPWGILVPSSAHSISPTSPDSLTGASNINGCVATHKLLVQSAQDPHTCVINVLTSLLLFFQATFFWDSYPLSFFALSEMHCLKMLLRRSVSSVLVF